ncbi:MAG: cyclase family protein [Bacillota bacterium]|nr:cyclase family protein [Bacillota bacterium]
MILYDISMTISPDITVYKNRVEKKPVFKETRNFLNNSVYETRIDMDLHTGTHIDMPLHLYPDGDASDKWNINQFLTNCLVLDFTVEKGVPLTDQHLEKKLHDFKTSNQLELNEKSILLKTNNSIQEKFDFNFTYLDQSGAAFLAEKSISGVGIDTLGIERNQPCHETHKLLLKTGIWIIEGLRLHEVPQGEYILVILPLKLQGVEAMPARAVILTPGSICLS